MKPSVGRIVHYKAAEGHCYAAVVTDGPQVGTWLEQDANVASQRESVTLNIMPPMRDAFQREAFEGDVSGTWHWPERVE